jgi:hypothetical protein
MGSGESLLQRLGADLLPTPTAPEVARDPAKAAIVLVFPVDGGGV